jgi:hypothetical protein
LLAFTAARRGNVGIFCEVDGTRIAEIGSPSVIERACPAGRFRKNTENYADVTDRGAPFERAGRRSRSGTRQRTVVAGDIKVSLAEVELLTIRIRLLICSIDKAEQIGLDWWKFDHHLSPGKQVLSAENEQLRKEIRLLERKVASLTRRRSTAGALR